MLIFLHLFAYHIQYGVNSFQMLVTQVFSETTPSHFYTTASYTVFQFIFALFVLNYIYICISIIYLFTAGAPSLVLAAIPPTVLPSTAAAALSSPHVIPVMNMGPGCPPRNGE